MVTDILKAINNPTGREKYILFDVRDLRDADMICKGMFYTWSDLMGKICGDIRGNVTYTIEQSVSRYYATISVLYDPANTDISILPGSEPLRLLAKYRVYIYINEANNYSA